jgi:small-conductance mechanosensitive channel
VENPTGLKVFWSLVVIILTMLISRMLKNIIYKKMNDNKRYYPIKQKINYLSGIVVTVCLLFIWLNAVSNFTTYIGLLSAGIAIALKEIFTNIAGWMFIELRKPFVAGHRIMIGDQKGDVIDIRLFQFTLMEVSPYDEGEQSTGRIIDIPNGFVFIHPTINYTKGFEYIWNEIKILLTFESNWRKAKGLLLAIANQDTEMTKERVSKQIKNASKKYMIHYNKLTPIVYTDIKESGIQLSIRYLCEPKQRRTTSNKIWEDVLVMLEKHDDIQLAYPTRRVID